MRFFEFKQHNKQPLTEGARIEHMEDLVFRELPPSRGANRAIQSLISLEEGGHQDVTIKWDGSPAVIFGRNEEGEFVFTDKSGFVAKGYDGKATSAQALKQMLMNRPGYKNNPDGYGELIKNMTTAYNNFEKAVSKDFRGYLKGDMLYFSTPETQDGDYVFTPNIVTYRVKEESEIGRKIANSECGIVIHRLVDENGTERALQGNEIETIMSGETVLVLPPVTAQEPPQVDSSALQELKSIVSKNAKAMDRLLDPSVLEEMKVKDLPNIFYTYLNSKVDTGLTNLAEDFIAWLKQSKVSQAKQKKIIDMINSNVAGYNAIWQLVSGIMRVKDDIINQLEQQEADVRASIGPHGPVNPDAHGEGGEGYVLAHPEGDIKLVPRAYFSRANRSVER